ncbi:hypothetical protein [Pseudonocardia sp. McavD-2-B]|uniref:hypothetical protein n=1 Tax=Pseudonocardia sp. McavD-2-B TaxID=2954499 RepID=UPI002097A0AB|nr:hypothetical protein [Pseudonocardia sp. McavD-2-B]MCO7193324.1 hypothetical protein [Pseudonocardia sp. McavD-2-B]
MCSLAGHEPTRTLKGFIRPVRRLQKRLVYEGLLPPDIPDALITIDNPSFAIRFEVPDKFRDVLCPDG